MSLPGICTVAYHPRHGQPSVSQPVAPVHLVSGEPGRDAQDTTVGEHGFVRLVHLSGRNDQNREFSSRFEKAVDLGDRLVIFK